MSTFDNKTKCSYEFIYTKSLFQVFPGHISLTLLLSLKKKPFEKTTIFLNRFNFFLNGNCKAWNWNWNEIKNLDNFFFFTFLKDNMKFKIELTYRDNQ